MASDLEMTIVYTRDDFLNSTAPYEDVFAYINDRFDLERELEKMSERAKLAGVKNFKSLFKGYCEKIKKVNNQLYAENLSNFDGQALELITGSWTANDDGVFMQGQYGETIACVHPIYPIRRLVNVDSGIEKLEIAFKKGYQWRRIICDKKQLASSNTIVPALADYGVAVTSESARHLVQYLHDIEHLNYDKIPESKSVSRLGWIGDEGFSPYVEDLIFDGDISFKHYFESVKAKGSYKKWLSMAKEVRAHGNIPAKILLAASFASVLVEPCGCLPFFVHLYGGTETGKTAGLKLAASVWANPEMGKYIHTFNSTAVAQELSAGFVNSLPLMLDELQIIRDQRDFDQIIYQLSEGVGRARGQKTGGLQRTTTWQNCIITTGEQPISSGHSGGGALNRIIEINCEDVKLFNDPTGMCEIVRHNYGHAGKLFIEAFQKDPELMDTVKEVQQEKYRLLTKTKTTEKQALAASIILTADELANMLIFNDGQTLDQEDVAEYLSTKDEVSANIRAYEWLMGWMAQHSAKFDRDNDRGGEVYGLVEFGRAYIIKNVFDKACQDNGFNSRTFLMWMKKEGLIEFPETGRNLTIKKTLRTNQPQSRCVVLTEVDGQIAGFEEIDSDSIYQ